MLGRENYIKSTVKLSRSNEVVITRVEKVKLCQVVLLHQMIHDIHSVDVLGVDITVPSDIYFGVVIPTQNVFQAGVKTGYG